MNKVITSCIGPKVIDHDPDDIETRSPPLKMIRAWDKEELYARLDRCAVLLLLRGCITPAEKDKIQNRIQKNLSSGHYHEELEQ